MCKCNIITVINLSYANLEHTHTPHMPDLIYESSLSFSFIRNCVLLKIEMYDEALQFHILLLLQSSDPALLSFKLILCLFDITYARKRAVSCVSFITRMINRFGFVNTLVAPR